MDAPKDMTLLSVGKKCSSPSCGLVDYLPFKVSILIDEAPQIP